MKISLYMANPESFINLILPLFIQSKVGNYDVDKITVVFGFQRLVCFSVNQTSEFVIK